MGTYLSTPITEKGQEEGECTNSIPLAWGVVDMQGWRKTMEDAHLANCTDNPNYKVFGVFDGHGGPEVARFSALYLMSVLNQMLQQQQVGQESNDNDNENTEIINMGQALRESFHVLDILLDERHEELIRLRAIAPEPAEQRQIEQLPPNSPTTTSKKKKNYTNNPSAAGVSDDCRPDCVQEEETPVVEGGEIENNPAENNNKDCDDSNEINKDKSDDDDDDNEDADSQEAAGKDEAAELDQDLSSDDEEVDDDAAAALTAANNRKEQKNEDDSASKVSGVFQRLLKLGSASNGQVVLQVGQNGITTASSPPENDNKKNVGPSASKPTVIRNGQYFCNLPDHPIHAGATAIVAVINNQDKMLTVANAGDSRAVLCRQNGLVVALSEDHKPMQLTELSRIRNAGGFVNSFGRVNGNLNLSRSIGDLKYKQVPKLSPAEQIITAEPDILQVTLDDSDEFIILGCDGIWDCLTNEKAVEFVRSRIHDKTPVEIGREMLDTIISDDPRVTQGIGGDNMTVMIIDLQPQSRKYRASNTNDSTTTPLATSGGDATTANKNSSRAAAL